MQYLRFCASQCAGRHITCQQYQSDALCRLRHRVAHGFSGDPGNLCSACIEVVSPDSTLQGLTGG